MPNFVNTSKEDIVKLCQTDYGKNFTYYATLFSTTDKIPIYSANVVNINRNQTTHRRPKNSLWKRVATTLCNATHLSPDVYYSEIGRPGNNSCETLQALNDDYKNNKLGLVRGHLNPNSINKRFRAKQKATFTLTNAAPQFKYFNQLWWSVVECITEQTILDWAQNEDVYVMTGTFGKGNPSKLNSVTVPEFYWKAVCYPGNETTNTQAFGYAIMRPNVRKSQRFFFKNYTTLEAFTKKMFSIDSPPFGNNHLCWIWKISNARKKRYMGRLPKKMQRTKKLKIIHFAQIYSH